MSYCILSLDGGGIRGLITASIIKRLDAEPDIEGWRSKTKMIVGTSTGALLGMGLGLKKAPGEIVDFYKINGPKIFHGQLLREIKDVGNLVGAKYDNDVLEQTLKDLLGARTMLQDLSPTVVVPTFNLDSAWKYTDGTGKPETAESWRPKIFHNDVADPNGDDGAELAYQVGLRTSAAPTYFPTYGSYIDGGVVANNPSMVAVAQALAGSSKAPGRTLNDIVVLSLGTGALQTKVSGRDRDWGDAEWLKAGIISIMMDGAMDIARYQCDQLLGKRTMRVSPYLDTNITLDDASPESIQHMEDIVDAMDLTLVTKWIKDNWK